MKALIQIKDTHITRDRLNTIPSKPVLANLQLDEDGYWLGAESNTQLDWKYSALLFEDRDFEVILVKENE